MDQNWTNRVLTFLCFSIENLTKINATLNIEILRKLVKIGRSDEVPAEWSVIGLDNNVKQIIIQLSNFSNFSKCILILVNCLCSPGVRDYWDKIIPVLQFFRNK